MLKTLLSGEEDWEFLLIKDVYPSNGNNLLKQFIMENVKRNHQVHVVTYDNPITNSQEIHYHDGYSDPCHWKENVDSSNSHSKIITYETDIETYFQTHLTSTDKEYVIAFNSLSTLMFHKSVDEICRALKRLQFSFTKSGKKLKIICLVHEDAHDDLTLNKVDFISSTILQLSLQKGNWTHCNITHKRNRKVIKEKIDFEISDLGIRIEKPKSKHEKPQVKSQPDPTCGLTFKLQLEANERSARDQLVLPYTKTRDEGEIIYEFDKNDDFDEEDPDDDLTI